MVSVTRDSPPSRDNFTERLYENCVTETYLIMHIFQDASAKNAYQYFPFFLSSSFFLSIVVFSHSANGLTFLTQKNNRLKSVESDFSIKTVTYLNLIIMSLFLR